MEDNYEPFGPEWEAELMKLPKKVLIDMIRKKEDSTQSVEEFEATDEILVPIQAEIEEMLNKPDQYTFQIKNAILKYFAINDKVIKYLGEQIDWENKNRSPLELLTDLQKELGYKTGELSTVAMLGLVGEAGEVLNETHFSMFNDRMNTVCHSALDGCKLADEFKKEIRKSPNLNLGTLELRLENESKFDVELADTLYYLNILALNRGRTLDYYAKLSHDKVRAKMQTPTGSSEQQTR